jgi:hypothetical protein
MSFSWPKTLMLWLAIAAYSVQAVVGGTGWAICLGGIDHQAVDEAVVISTCDHDGDCGSSGMPRPRVVQQHADDEHCPCTDISIDDSEPVRVENPVKFTVAKAQLQDALIAHGLMALSAPRLAAMKVCVQPPWNVGTAPQVVRTIVLLI